MEAMAKHHTYSIELGQNYPHDFTMSQKKKRILERAHHLERENLLTGRHARA